MKKLAILLSGLLCAGMAIAASAADPLINIDFANGAGDVELVEAEIVEDATRGNVLQVNGAGQGTNRQSYGLYTTPIFENNTWENGMTVSMWIKTAEGSSTLHGTAPIFSIDIANIGYISVVTSLESAINTDGNDTSLGISPRCWNDPVNIGGGMNMTEEGVWQMMTVTYSPDGMKLYMDGELYSEPVINTGTNDDFLFQVEFAYALRLGSWLCDWWNYGDYEGMIDDVLVYNTALTADEISALYSSTKIDAASAPAASAEAAPAADFVTYTEYPETPGTELVYATGDMDMLTGYNGTIGTDLHNLASGGQSYCLKGNTSTWYEFEVAEKTDVTFYVGYIARDGGANRGLDWSLDDPNGEKRVFMDIPESAEQQWVSATFTVDAGKHNFYLYAPTNMDDSTLKSCDVYSVELYGAPAAAEEAPVVEEAPAAEPVVEEAPVVEEPVVEEVVVEEPVVEEVVEEIVEEVAEEAPVVEETVEEAPQTFDFGIIAAVAALVSLAGFAVSKKR